VNEDQTMEEEKKDEDLNEFMNSNRSGRRNALTSDGKEVEVENKELEDKLQDLSIEAGKEEEGKS